MPTVVTSSNVPDLAEDQVYFWQTVTDNISNSDETGNIVLARYMSL